MLNDCLTRVASGFPEQALVVDDFLHIESGRLLLQYPDLQRSSFPDRTLPGTLPRGDAPDFWALWPMLFLSVPFLFSPWPLCGAHWPLLPMRVRFLKEALQSLRAAEQVRCHPPDPKEGPEDSTPLA